MGRHVPSDQVTTILTRPGDHYCLVKKNYSLRRHSRGKPCRHKLRRFTVKNDSHSGQIRA